MFWLLTFKTGLCGSYLVRKQMYFEMKFETETIVAIASSVNV